MGPNFLMGHSIIFFDSRFQTRLFLFSGLGYNVRAMKRPVLVVLTSIAVIICVGLVVRFVFGGNEDTWICDHGAWVQHGQPSSAKPTTACPGANANANVPYYDDATNQQVIVLKKAAIVKAYPDLKDFEQTDGFAGHEVRVVGDNSDHYFAYLILGSGVPIAEANCYRVDRAMRVFQVGVFPDPVDSYAGYRDVNPRNCQGIK